MQPVDKTEGRMKLLETDDSIVIPEKEKGLSFDAKQDKDNYSQNEIDDILKLMTGGGK